MKGLSGLLILLGQLLPQCFLLGILLEQLLSQSGQVCLKTRRLLLSVATLSLALGYDLLQASGNTYKCTLVEKASYVGSSFIIIWYPS